MGHLEKAKHTNMGRWRVRGCIGADTAREQGKGGRCRERQMKVWRQEKGAVTSRGEEMFGFKLALGSAVSTHS